MIRKRAEERRTERLAKVQVKIQHPKDAVPKPKVMGGPVIIDITQTTQIGTRDTHTYEGRPGGTHKNVSVNKDVAEGAMVRAGIKHALPPPQAFLQNTDRPRPVINKDRVQGKKNAWRMLALVTKQAHAKRQMQRGGDSWMGTETVNDGEHRAPIAIKAASSRSPPTIEDEPHETPPLPGEISQVLQVPRFELSRSTPNGSSISYDGIEDIDFEDILLGE